MSVTRLKCPECGYVQIHCQCREELDKWLAENVMKWSSKKRYPHGLCWHQKDEAVETCENWTPATNIAHALECVRKIKWQFRIFTSHNDIEFLEIEDRNSHTMYFNKYKDIPECAYQISKTIKENWE